MDGETRGKRAKTEPNTSTPAPKRRSKAAADPQAGAKADPRAVPPADPESEAQVKPTTSPQAAPGPKAKRTRKAADAGAKDKAVGSEAKPAKSRAKKTMTQAEPLALAPRGKRREKVAPATEDGPLRSVRLSDAAFAGRLLGKYGWAVGAPKGRTPIVHRDGVTGAQRPSSRSMHVDLHIRNVRPLLQLYTRVFATVHPPKAAVESRREPRPAAGGAAGAIARRTEAPAKGQATTAGAGSASAQAAAVESASVRRTAPAPTSQLGSSANGSPASSATHVRKLSEVRRIWETFRETATTLRRIETLQRTALSAPRRLAPEAALGAVTRPVERSEGAIPLTRRTLREAAVAGIGGKENAAASPVRVAASGARGSAAPTVESPGSAAAAAPLSETAVRGVFRRATGSSALQRLVHAKASGGLAMRLRSSPFAAKSSGAADLGGGSAVPRVTANAPLAASRRTPATQPLQRITDRSAATNAEPVPGAVARSFAAAEETAARHAPRTESTSPVVMTPSLQRPVRPVYRVERKEMRSETLFTRRFDRSSLQEVVRHMTRLASSSTVSERTMTVVRRLIEKAASRSASSPRTAHASLRSDRQAPKAAIGGAAKTQDSLAGSARPIPEASGAAGSPAAGDRHRAFAPSMVPLRPGRLAASGVAKARTTGVRSPEAVVAHAEAPSSAPARMAALAPLQRRIAEGKPLAAPIPVAAPAVAAATSRFGAKQPVPLVMRLLTIIERNGWHAATRTHSAARPIRSGSPVRAATEARAGDSATGGGNATPRANNTAARSGGTPPAQVGLVQRRPVVLVRGGVSEALRLARLDGDLGARASMGMPPASAQQARSSPPAGQARVPLIGRTSPRQLSSRSESGIGSAQTNRAPFPAGGSPVKAGRFGNRITQRFQDRYAERLTVRFAERAAQVEGRLTSPATVNGAATPWTDASGRSNASAPPLQTARPTWSRREANAPERVELNLRRRIVDATSAAGVQPRPSQRVMQPAGPVRAIAARPGSAASRSTLLHRAARGAAALQGARAFQASAVGSRTSPLQRAVRPSIGHTAASEAAIPAPAAQTYRGDAAQRRPSAVPAPAAQTHRIVATLRRPSAVPTPPARTHRIADASAAPPAAPARRTAVRGSPLVHRAAPLSAASAAGRGIAAVRPGATIGHAVTESTVAPVQRHVRDLRLDVAAKTNVRDRPSQDPVVQTLHHAVKTVEAELEKAKELWAKPKLDMNRLSDQLYKELSKRIRFESQRRGL